MIVHTVRSRSHVQCFSDREAAALSILVFFPSSFFLVWKSFDDLRPLKQELVVVDNIQQQLPPPSLTAPSSVCPVLRVIASLVKPSTRVAEGAIDGN